MKKDFKILLQLSPLLIIFLTLFITGFLVTFLQSVKLMGSGGEGFSFLSYKMLFQNRRFSLSLLYSLIIAFSSSLLSILAGTSGALFLWKVPVNIRKYGIVYKIPLILPHITIAFMTVLFLGRTGILSRIGYNLGFLVNFTDFPNILYSGKGFGIIIAYTVKETSFVMLMVMGVLVKLPKTQIQTAGMLGATPFQVFYTLTLPYITPILKVSFIIIFLYSLGAFDIPYIMSESQPEMISVSVFNTFFKRDLIHRSEAAAELVILFTLSLGALLWFFKLKGTRSEK